MSAIGRFEATVRHLVEEFRGPPEYDPLANRTAGALFLDVIRALEKLDADREDEHRADVAERAEDEVTL